MPNRWEQPASFLRSGDPEAENEPSLQYKGLLGVRFTDIQPTRGTSPSASTDKGRSKTYQIVQTDSTMSVAPFLGAVAWWSDKTKYLVTTTVTTLGRGRIAGIFKNSVTPGNYCCVQIHGPSTVKFVDSPTSAPDATGKFVIPSATNGKADCLAAASSPTFPSLGYSAGAITGSDSTAIVDLDIPETT